jgi:GrpB-like predicted nucleotidyltransferase (UPF0157 family)
MKLGLKFEEVRLVDYTPEWKDEFEKVQQTIMENTNINKDRIEHIGSTAIKDIPAKPIIDILVGVDELSKDLEKLYWQSLQMIHMKQKPILYTWLNIRRIFGII